MRHGAGAADGRRDGDPFVSLRALLLRVPVSKAEITTVIAVGALDRFAAERSDPELFWQARLWLLAIQRAPARAGGTGQGRLLLEPWSHLPLTYAPTTPPNC